MRVKFQGDLPTWFWIVWLCGLVVWIVFSIVNHKAAPRATAVTVEQDAWTPQPFELTVHERVIVGVEQLDQSVIFGPSGRQMAAAFGLPVVALVAAGAVAILGPTRWIVLLVLLGSSGLVVYALAGTRVRVWLTPSGVTIRDRFSRQRTFPWRAVIDVRTVMRPSAQVDGTSNSAAVGVATIAGERDTDLPGFRCIAWVNEVGMDDLAVTHAKVAIVRRYRERLHGPWPKV